MSSAIQAVLKTAPRRATLRKIRNLAAQKPRPIEFTPSNAYIIMGHGRDSDKMIKVPDNCIVVVKYRPGELGHESNIYPLWNTVGAPENTEIYRDPLHHIPEVINQLGDVLIYKPGDRCPNFRYNLILSEDNFMAPKFSNHWGLIKTPLQSPVENIIIPDDKGIKIKPLVLDLYKESVFPKGNITVDILIKLLKLGDDPSLNDCFELLMDIQYVGVPELYHGESPFKSLMASFSISQKQLFRLNSEGVAERPGVYYNFVCRQVPGIEYAKVRNGPHINIVSRFSSLREVPKNARSLLEKRIGEAETKRKQLLRGTKYNTPAARKTRRRRN